MYLNYRELDADIIIIGAGLTGLGAAYHLLEKDPHADFLVLDVYDESDFTVGQRCSSFWTTSNAGVKKKIEFASDHIKPDFQFVRVEQTNLINLMKKLNIQMIPFQTHQGEILIDYDELHTVPRRENILDFFDFKERKIFNSYCKEVDKLNASIPPLNSDVPSDIDNISMNTLLNRMISSKKVHDVVSQFFLFTTGLRPKEISASFFIAYCSSNRGIKSQFIWNENSPKHFHIEGGAENIRCKILEVIEQYVTHVSEIKEISWDDFCAGIRTSDEYFFANKIIFTLNENQTNHIHFVPPLSNEKKMRADSLVKGNLKKFILKYSEPFWIKKGLSGEVYVMNTDKRNGPIHICLNVSMLVNSNSYMLAGLAEKRSEKREILNQLRLYFGEEALTPDNYEEISTSFHDLSFPYGFKSMKYLGNISEDTERIVWATPELENAWYGTAASSIAAGFKGAIRVLQEMKPNTLTLDDLDRRTGLEIMYVPPSTVGIKWHYVTPTLIILIFAIARFRRYFSDKPVKL